MKKVHRFVIWICSKFTRSQIEIIIQDLQDILANRNPEVKPKDDFKEKHPNYRNFFVDPEPPLSTRPEPTPKLNFKELLADYKKLHGHPLKPVNPHKSQTIVPKDSICKSCNAPAKYLYFNDGKKRSQLKCKVCGSLSTVHPRHKSKYFCPHCESPLSLWKKRLLASIYKCYNNNCRAYLSNLSKLNPREKNLFKTNPTQFKLRYHFREYHFSIKHLSLSAPKKSPSIFNIHNSLNTLCLALTFHVSFGLSARKTALVLKNVFSISVSRQTILNYTQHAAYYCHSFNLNHKGNVDDTQAGDEAYIKIKGKQFYTFFFISSKSRKITAYHIHNSRDTLPATVAMNEAIRTANPEQNIILITDGNPSYPAGIHFINQARSKSISHKKVIGIQNLDSVSEEFRPFKQIIERLNRTYKFHIRAAYGFKNFNGAIALTTLFVTHYNFIRPHSSLNYSVPIPLSEIENIYTFHGKWAKILNIAADLPTPSPRGLGLPIAA